MKIFDFQSIENFFVLKQEKMIKKLFPLIFILFFAHIVFAIEYPIAVNEWGNSHFINSITTTPTVDNENIRCFGFNFLRDGYIDSVYTPVIGLGVLEERTVTIDYGGVYSYPMENNQQAYFKTGDSTEYTFDNTLSGANHKNYDFEKGGEALICFGAGAISDHQIYVNQLVNYPMDISQVSSIIPSWDTTERLQYNTLYSIPYNGSIKGAYNASAGLWVWSEDNANRILSTLKICQRDELSTSSNKYCYYPFSYVGTQAYVNNGEIDSLLFSKGEFFKWNFEDNAVDSVDVWLYGQTGFNNVTQTLHFTFVETDILGNITNILYHKSGILATGIEDSSNNGAWFNFTFPASITIEEDKYYSWLIGCDNSCNLASRGLNIGFTNFNSNGFYGNDAKIITNTSTGTTLSSINDLTFKLVLDNNPNYESETIIDTDFCLYSPHSYCLFYDNFNYADFYDLTQREYDITSSSFFVQDEILYSYRNYSALTKIQHNLEITDYPYDEVESVYTFDIANKITPVSMDLDNETTRYIIYRLKDYCDTTQTSYIQLTFFRFYNHTSSVWKTLANVYVFEFGVPKQLGTFTFQNGETFDVKNRMNFETKRGFIIIEKDDIFLSEMSLNYGYDLGSDCKVNNFAVSRDGAFNTDDTFIGIKSIAYSGILGEIGDEDYSYLYTNQTTQDDAHIKGDVGEYINNWAFTLGFKTTASKLFFWLIILIILSLLISQVDASPSIKGFAVGFVIILGIIVGWYFKFIPTIILVFLMFIVSILGAFMYHKSIGGGSE